MLSIDPSSPFTQGALLGDRIRLTEHFLDQGVFIRSMANRGALGGLSEAALQAALLLDAAGREDVFVETVGVGQAEIDIIDHADTIVLVLMPGSGDSIQALKAGVMEIPDVIVINKADHPLTDTMVREIRGVLSLANLDRTPEEVRGAAGACRSSRPRPARGTGVDELVERLDAAPRAHPRARGSSSERRGRNLRNEVLAIATARMRRRLEEELHEDPDFQQLIDEVVERRLDPASAAATLLERGLLAAALSTSWIARLTRVGSAAMDYLDLADRNWPLLGRLMGGPHGDLPRHARARSGTACPARRRCCCSTTSARKSGKRRTSPLVYGARRRQLRAGRLQGRLSEEPGLVSQPARRTPTRRCRSARSTLRRARARGRGRGARAPVGADGRRVLRATRATARAPSARSRWSCSSRASVARGRGWR